MVSIRCQDFTFPVSEVYLRMKNEGKSFYSSELYQHMELSTLLVERDGHTYTSLSYSLVTRTFNEQDWILLRKTNQKLWRQNFIVMGKV